MLDASVLSPVNLGRAAALTSLALLSVTVAFGIVIGARHQGRWLTSAQRVAIHRNLALLTLAFLAVHITGAELAFHLQVLDAFVPFLSSFRRLFVGLGAISLDILLLGVVTSLLRHRLSYRAWRVVHLLLYVSWPIGVVHSLDTDNLQPGLPALRIVGDLSVALVAAACAWYVIERRDNAVVRRFGGFAAMLVLALIGVIANAHMAGSPPTGSSASTSRAEPPVPAAVAGRLHTLREPPVGRALGAKERGDPSI